MKLFTQFLLKIFTEDEVQEIFRCAEERRVTPRALIRQAVITDLFR